jgi:hypothetical protein
VLHALVLPPLLASQYSHSALIYTNTLILYQAAGAVSYLGPFTSDFRQRIAAQWVAGLTARGVPHSAGTTMEKTLADPAKLSR